MHNTKEFLNKQTVRTALLILISLILSITSLLIFFYLAEEALEKEFAIVDITIGAFVYGIRTPFLTEIMIALSSLGGNFYLILASLILVILLVKKHQKEAVIFCLVLIMGLVLNYFFKIFFQIPRPTTSQLVVENSYSFPSGHAMNSFIFYSLLAYFSYHFFHNKTLTIIFSVLALILIFLIGFSRIYLGVHYPSDVLAGFVAGFWVLTTALLIENILLLGRVFKKSE